MVTVIAYLIADVLMVLGTVVFALVIVGVSSIPRLIRRRFVHRSPPGAVAPRIRSIGGTSGGQQRDLEPCSNRHTVEPPACPADHSIKARGDAGVEVLGVDHAGGSRRTDNLPSDKGSVDAYAITGSAGVSGAAIRTRHAGHNRSSR